MRANKMSKYTSSYVLNINRNLISLPDIRCITSYKIIYYYVHYSKILIEIFCRNFLKNVAS